MAETEPMPKDDSLLLFMWCYENRRMDLWIKHLQKMDELRDGHRRLDVE
jgi:hypothetical protein